MALLYDDHRFDDNRSLKSMRFYKYLKSLLGFNPVAEGEFLIFECAEALWEGHLDGSVDPNPMCKDCYTQLSFTQKDAVMCDTCHKNKHQDGEFYFLDDLKAISYQDAYRLAKLRWKQILEKYSDEASKGSSCN